MNEEAVHYLTEIRLNRELSLLRFHRDKLIRGITTLLADLTKYAAVVVTEDGIFYSGLYNLLDYPEFVEKSSFKNILIAFDDLSTLSNVFSRGFTDSRVKVVIGDEFDQHMLKDCSIVFTEINLYNSERAIMAVIGPRRMGFSQVLPLVRMCAEVIDKLILGWES
jgi:transcriptional regulator of heat shock response